MGELLDLYREHAASLGRSPVTLREYRRIVEQELRPELGNWPIWIWGLLAKRLVRSAGRE